MFLQPAQIKIATKIISCFIPRIDLESTLPPYWVLVLNCTGQPQETCHNYFFLSVFFFLHLMIYCIISQVENPELPKIEIEIPSQLKLKLEDDCYFIKRKKKVCYNCLHCWFFFSLNTQSPQKLAVDLICLFSDQLNILRLK